MTPRPPAVETLAAALADWLASFPVPAPLGAAMADACAAGASWPAGVAAVSARRTGWTDAAAIAWGIGVGALAGALEAARASVTDGGAEHAPDSGTAVDGRARELLAADGLIAAAHEAIASLEPSRLSAAFTALDEAFRDGGPWTAVREGREVPAWPRLIPVALGPAARVEPAGPWEEVRRAWRDARPPGGTQEEPALWRAVGLDDRSSELLREAALAAGTVHGG